MRQDHFFRQDKYVQDLVYADRHTVTDHLVSTASGLEACPKQNLHAGKYLQDPSMLCVCMWSLCGFV